MTKIEALELELKARKMVEGTELDWTEVLHHKRLEHTPIALEHYELSDIELALGIIEGKPVWEGDELYYHEYKVQANKHHEPCLIGWSWNPPAPKTIMVELDYDVVVHTAGLRPDIAPALTKACRKALEEMK